MTAPRLEIRLDRLHHNAATLTKRLAVRGIAVTAVTKATLGDPIVALELIDAGVHAVADSRIANIERLRAAGIRHPVVLLRSPMVSEANRVVMVANLSCNTEPTVLRSLNDAAGRHHVRHGIILMVELGDLREGIMPADLVAIAAFTMTLTNLDLIGIGTNLACQSGVEPDERNMAELSALAGDVEQALGVRIATVSGGNSANLNWVDASESVGRVNDLRLGEAILLGREPLHRAPIDGLHLDVFTLVAEVIEAKSKPLEPWGVRSQAAFGPAFDDSASSPAPCPTQAAPPDPTPADATGADRTPADATVSDAWSGDTWYAILAIGRQDVDPDGVTWPDGIHYRGASSDHIVVTTTTGALAVGDEVRLGLNYSALLRAKTSPFVTTVHLRR